MKDALGTTPRRAQFRTGQEWPPTHAWRPPASPACQPMATIGIDILTLKEPRAPCATDYRVLHRPADIVLYGAMAMDPPVCIRGPPDQFWREKETTRTTTTATTQRPTATQEGRGLAAGTTAPDGGRPAHVHTVEGGVDELQVDGIVKRGRRRQRGRPRRTLGSAPRRPRVQQ